MRALLGVAVLSVCGWFVGLGAIDFLDEQEARDAVVTEEMAARREVLTPVYGGKEHFEKPVLAYALELLGLRLTPSSPVGPRALDTLAAALLVAVIAWLGSGLLGRGAGLCGAAVLATTVAMPLAARTDGTQVWASLFAWLGFAGVASRLRGGSGAFPLVLGYVALAAAGLLAGPMAGLWPLVAVLLLAAIERDPSVWRAVRPYEGLAILVGLWLPWYGFMIERFGPPFVLALPAMPYALPPTDPWYATPSRTLGFLVVGFFPWSALLPGAAAQAYRQWRHDGTELLEPVRARLPGRLVAAALLAGLMPSLFAPGAPLPSVLPAVPAAALLVGAELVRLFSGDVLTGRMVAQGARLLTVSGTIAAVLLAWVSGRLGPAAPALRLLAAFLLLAAWAPWLAAFIGRLRAVPALLALMVALGTPLVALRALPTMSGVLNVRPVGEAMLSVASPDAVLVLPDPPPPSLRLALLPRHLVVTSDLGRALRSHRGADGYAYVAFRPSRESAVARASSPIPLEILIRTPGLVLARAGR